VASVATENASQAEASVCLPREDKGREKPAKHTQAMLNFGAKMGMP